MNIKGVVFDFNGTMFWDTEINNLAWNRFLVNQGFNLDFDSVVEVIHGKNNQQSVRHFFGDRLSNSEVDRLSREKEIVYQSICKEKKPQMAPGIIPFLEFLKENNIPATIASASIPENIDFYFDYLGMNKYFNRSLVVYNDGIIRSKPYPDYYINAMKNLGLSNTETLVFEDSMAGIQSAERAEVAKIIIVDSNNDDYSAFDYQIIKSFDEVDKELFKNN